MRVRAASLLALSIALAAASPARAQSSTGDCAPDLAALSGWDGVWISEGNETGINGRVAAEAPLNRRLDGFDAPWNALGWGRFGAMLRIAVAGETKQAGWGFPMMMNTVAPLKFVIAPNETVTLAEIDGPHDGGTALREQVATLDATLDRLAEELSTTRREAGSRLSDASASRPLRR